MVDDARVSDGSLWREPPRYSVSHVYAQANQCSTLVVGVKWVNNIWRIYCIESCGFPCQESLQHLLTFMSRIPTESVDFYAKNLYRIF